MEHGLTSAAPSRDVLDHVDAASFPLTAAERRRAGQFWRAADRDDFLAAHILLRLVAAAALGRPVDDVPIRQRCPECGGPHGRPQLVGHPPWQLSLTHSRGFVAAAAATGPVGVDLERSHPGTYTPDLGAVTLAPAERELISEAGDADETYVRLWVRKEVLVKAGRAELGELADLDVSAMELPDPAVLAAGGVVRGDLQGLSFLEWATETDEGRIVGAAGAEPGLAHRPWPELIS